MNREIPFNFILDYLLPIPTNVQPFFGMTAIYSRHKLLLMLRDRSNEPGMNGIWIATAKNGDESLLNELTELRLVWGPKKKKKEDGWLLLPAKAGAFEETAIRICDLIVQRDPRIGKITRSSALM